MARSPPRELSIELVSGGPEPRESPNGGHLGVSDAMEMSRSGSTSRPPCIAEESLFLDSISDAHFSHTTVHGCSVLGVPDGPAPQILVDAAPPSAKPMTGGPRMDASTDDFLGPPPALVHKVSAVSQRLKETTRRLQGLQSRLAAAGVQQGQGDGAKGSPATHADPVAAEGPSHGVLPLSLQPKVQEDPAVRLYNQSRERLARKATEIMKRQQEREDAEAQQCSFRPAVSQLAQAMERPSVAESTALWQRDKERHLEKLRVKKAVEEVAEVRPPELSQRSLALAARKKERQQQPASEVQTDLAARQAQLEELRQQLQRERNITFTPKINRTVPTDDGRKTSATEVGARLYEQAFRRPSVVESQADDLNSTTRSTDKRTPAELAAHIQQMAEKEAEVARRREEKRRALEAEELRGSFKPTIDAGSQRLVAEANRPPIEKRPAVAASASAAPKQPPPPTKKISAGEVAAFVKRQADHVANVGAKKDALVRRHSLDEQAACTFTPKVTAQQPQAKRSSGSIAASGAKTARNPARDPTGVPPPSAHPQPQPVVKQSDYVPQTARSPPSSFLAPQPLTPRRRFEGSFHTQRLHMRNEQREERGSISLASSGEFRPTSPSTGEMERLDAKIASLDEMVASWKHSVQPPRGSARSPRTSS